MSVAVIRLGGKQFTVEPGKIIVAPSLPDEPGSSLTMTDLLAGKAVKGTVVEHTKGEKIRIVKFKNKTRYTRVAGHRSKLTKVKIDTIA